MEVLRGDVIESVHRVSIAVAEPDGMLRAHTGNPDLVVFARSAVKPVQALPLVEDGVADRFGWADPELALACASHSGEAGHVELAAAMLASLGLSADALACGPHAPFSEDAAGELRRRGRKPGRLHNNCSGKHAGMLALASAHGWPLQGYHEVGHPVQVRMLREMSRWSDVRTEDIGVAIDGCGVATFAMPLRALALVFARFAIGARTTADPTGRLIHAMTSHPELVGGSGRLCTELMRTTGGRIFAKVGAEGVYCAGVAGTGIGIALKVEDGSKRAAEPALLEVLRMLGLLAAEDLTRLTEFARPRVLNTRAETSGSLRARVALDTTHGGDTR